MTNDIALGLESPHLRDSSRQQTETLRLQEVNERCLPRFIPRIVNDLGADGDLGVQTRDRPGHYPVVRQVCKLVGRPHPIRAFG